MGCKWGIHGLTTFNVAPAAEVWALIAQKNADMKSLFTTMLSAGVLLAATPAFAQLDSTFATNGIYQTGLASTEDAITGAARQSDGKIVTCGYLRLSDFTYKAIVQRFDSSGVLDNSFSGDGKDIQPALHDCVWYDAKVQSDGKIVVAGYVTPDKNTSISTLVARYNADGTVDQSFGVGGTSMINPSSYDDNASSICIQPDGAILIGGKYQTYSSIFGYSDNAFIARLTTAGVLDTSFNHSGMVFFSAGFFGASAVNDIKYHDGKIYLTQSEGSSAVLRRLNPNGTTDTSFGQNASGSFSFQNTGTITPEAIDIAPDGKVVIAGSFYNGQLSHFNGWIARVLANGSGLDTNFGSSMIAGATFLSMGNAGNDAFCTGLHRRADGHYWLAGYVEPSSGDPAEHAALIITPEGDPLSYWGTGGNAIVATTTGRDYTAGSIAWGDRLLTFGHADSDNAMLKFKRSMIQTGIEAPTFAANVYPNPAREVLHIAADQPLTGELLSLTGTVVARYDGTGTLNISQLPAGIYLLRLVNTQGETSHQRVVIE